MKRSNIIKFQLENFVYTKLCVCFTNKRYIISILSSGSCPMDGTLGTSGSSVLLISSVCPLCFLLLNHWSHPLRPREGSKGQISLIFNYKLRVNFNDFLYQTLCVFLKRKAIKNRTQFSFWSLGHCPRDGTSGCLGVKNLIPSVCPLCYILRNQ